MIGDREPSNLLFSTYHMNGGHPSRADTCVSTFSQRELFDSLSARGIVSEAQLYSTESNIAFSASGYVGFGAQPDNNSKYSQGSSQNVSSYDVKNLNVNCEVRFREVW